MKRRAPYAFTLIEMVTVIAVMIVLAGLVISVAGFVQRKGAVEKATSQIKNLTLHLEAFKVDHGVPPQNIDTDTLDPRLHFSPVGGASGGLYSKAGRFLYSSLSGDFEPADAPDGKPEDQSKVYYAFPPNELSVVRDPAGNIRAVNHIQDPFGNGYGYSTAGLKAEQEYRDRLRQNPSEERPSTLMGFNPTYDLWSTGGATSGTQTGKWVRNWGN